MRSWWVPVVVAGAAAMLSGCGDDGSASGDQPTVVAEGFDQPTQLADGPDGLVLVAQLAGGENDATGEVVALDPDSGERTVVLEGLDKPTGVLWREGELWVMERRSLVRADWSGQGPAGSVEVVLEELPYNGRSEGTLTPLDDGRFLYETSGALFGGEIVEGSGTLFVFDTADGTSTPLVTGAKNAYAHVVLADGRLAVTEIGDTGGEQPPEELNIVPLGSISDLGWPACDGDATCDGVVSPIALFPPASTPTGVAISGTDAYVALFVTGAIVRVPLERDESDDLSASDLVIGELAGPHTLLPRPDGSLWVSEHFTGRILSITP